MRRSRREELDLLAPERLPPSVAPEEQSPPLTGGLPFDRADFGAGVAMLQRLQRAAGNRAATAARQGAVQRSCSCGGSCTCAGEEERAGEEGEPPLQKIGWGLLESLADTVGGLFGGGEAEPLQGGGAPKCTEEPTIDTASPVPVTINADSAVEFVQKMAQVLGNAHMSPSFNWNPDVDEKGRVTKVNLKITTKIIRPRFGNGRLGTGGRDPDKERALIKKAEALIQAHEERHRDVARDFARKAVCAAIGKTGDAVDKAIKDTLCAMNKAQEALDGKEGMLGFKLDPQSTSVVDVFLTGTTQSYPCS